MATRAITVQNYWESPNGILSTIKLKVIWSFSLEFSYREVFPSTNWILILENTIVSLDFDPSGSVVATMDNYGVCLISDLATSDYIFHVTPGTGGKFIWMSWNCANFPLIIFSRSFSCREMICCCLDNVARCRWTPNRGEPLLYIKYNWNLLNFLDMEKKTLLLRSGRRLDEDDCNLSSILATC